MWLIMRGALSSSVHKMRQSLLSAIDDRYCHHDLRGTRPADRSPAKVERHRAHVTPASSPAPRRWQAPTLRWAQLRRATAHQQVPAQPQSSQRFANTSLLRAVTVLCCNRPVRRRTCADPQTGLARHADPLRRNASSTTPKSSGCCRWRQNLHVTRPCEARRWKPSENP